MAPPASCLTAYQDFSNHVGSINSECDADFMVFRAWVSGVGEPREFVVANGGYVSTSSFAANGRATGVVILAYFDGWHYLDDGADVYWGHSWINRRGDQNNHAGDFMDAELGGAERSRRR